MSAAKAKQTAISQSYTGPERRARKRLRINLATMDEAVVRLAEEAQAGRGFSVFTLNLDHLVKLRFDQAFRHAYERAKFVTADGWPVAWMARRKGVKVERTTGADMVEPLCREAAERGLPVYLFGSSDGSLEKAAVHLCVKYPGLKIAGMEAPPYGFDPHSDMAVEAAMRIKQSGARLCFVALGAPRQELFADRAHKLCEETGFLCIGAALDFLAGYQERAPEIMQKTGAEWLYRLMKNPRRMASRYGGSAMLFAEMVLRNVLRRPDLRLDFSVRDLRK